MHSSKRTIDDMMCISDGCDPYHYIKGRGFDSEGSKSVLLGQTASKQ